MLDEGGDLQYNVCKTVDCCAHRNFSTHRKPTSNFDTTIYINIVSVCTTFLDAVCNWSHNILILWEEAECLWLISNDLYSTAKFCHTFWLQIKPADITQDPTVCFHTPHRENELRKLPLQLI
jgi:hypothetical protein